MLLAACFTILILIYYWAGNFAMQVTAYHFDPFEKHSDL